MVKGVLAAHQNDSGIVLNRHELYNHRAGWFQVVISCAEGLSSGSG